MGADIIVGCGSGGGSAAAAGETGTPEQLLANAFKHDLGVTMDPQALRIFIRWRWDRVQKLAHQIHDA